MKKDIKGNIGILAGRNIENHGDIGIEIGFIGDEYYIFGYPCINGGHTTIKELFRIRIDKDRLNKWSEYIDRLSIHIENKNKPIMKNQKFKVGDKVRVKPEYSHENTTEHEVFTISDVEHPCKNVVYFNHDDSLICSCPIEWLEKIDQKEIFTPKHCMGLSEEDAQDAIDTAERMQKTVKETFEFVNRNQPPTPESLSAKLIELTKTGKLKWIAEKQDHEGCFMKDIVKYSTQIDKNEFSLIVCTFLLEDGNIFRLFDSRIISQKGEIFVKNLHPSKLYETIIKSH